MGKSKEAMEFYKSIFGGELTMQTYEEMGMPTSEDNINNIVHAELKSDNIHLMASDGSSEHPITVGDNINLSLGGNDKAQLTEYFEKLSDGGSVDMPLEKQIWEDIFGMLTDKFGVHWMVNITKE